MGNLDYFGLLFKGAPQQWEFFTHASELEIYYLTMTVSVYINATIIIQVYSSGKTLYFSNPKWWPSMTNQMPSFDWLVFRAGSVADCSFRYPASVKPYRFRDTERRNCVPAYPHRIGPPTGSKIREKKTLQF